nr:hypothetical protein CFP56_44629 [Quercus suber]
MESIFINAPSSSSSMKCTYPPSHNKPSKLTLKHGNLAPPWNKRTHSFVLRSSSASLRLGRRGRHCGSLHSQRLEFFFIPKLRGAQIFTSIVRTQGNNIMIFSDIEVKHSSV